MQSDCCPPANRASNRLETDHCALAEFVKDFGFSSVEAGGDGPSFFSSLVLFVEGSDQTPLLKLCQKACPTGAETTVLATAFLARQLTTKQSRKRPELNPSQHLLVALGRPLESLRSTAGIGRCRTTPVA